MTRVIFRVWRDSGDVIALFPDTYGPPDSNPYMMQSYMHVGQHSEADYDAVRQRTRPATTSESESLRRELEDEIGYPALIAMRRFTRPGARFRG